jgi:Domain of unknown function (DUF5753)
MVPGLLQTADYARRLLETAYEPGDVGRAVAARLERQSILYDQAKRFDFLITESALRWRPQGIDMRPQVDRLISVASLPNVTLAVAPQGESPIPYLHPFVIWQLPEGTMVSVETYSAELWVHEAADVARYREVWERAAQAAAGPSWLAERAAELG